MGVRMTPALVDAPNIGLRLADALAEIGVSDLQTLTARGAVPVWEELRSAGLFDCVHSLLALEGAIHNVRWNNLDPTVRAALRDHAKGMPR